jgi:hypothetical protein
MQLRTTSSEDCWILSYTILGKTVTKKYANIAIADTYMYNLLSYAYKHVKDIKLTRVSYGDYTECNNSRVVRRWRLMQDQFPQLDTAIV